MTIVVDGIEAIKGLTGKDLGATEWVEITQDRVNMFADATDDHQWIHVDTGRAAAGPFSGTIAHGFLTLSLTVPLLGRLIRFTGIGMGINYGLNKVRFPAPVPVGSRIRMLGTVAEATPVGGGGAQLVLDFTVEAEGSAKPVCVAQAVQRFYP
ncbi:MaoC family dehydratase [Actinoplanes sp. NPDC051633]|uniref:MaoC family dehydratase n=1 Tax=Actinoplanes sp. NPDC051633 TaxID=3155670 RepID=UPI003425798B